ncbi:hypothetical protein AVEN_203166-1 [Araneus ventricosus]|uniref:Uncharacterized protein n=1 Tax=Araneus ventricosus TaxID=182803 RepID=A0A4Y2CGZ0_ARAVE|nr:hypothetical protein AVEN_203166-1 [Araneus ventricosus]
MHEARTHDKSSVESGLEPSTYLFQNRGFHEANDCTFDEAILVLVRSPSLVKRKDKCSKKLSVSVNCEERPGTLGLEQRFRTFLVVRTTYLKKNILSLTN